MFFRCKNQPFNAKNSAAYICKPPKNIHLIHQIVILIHSYIVNDILGRIGIGGSVRSNAVFAPHLNRENKIKRILANSACVRAIILLTVDIENILVLIPLQAVCVELLIRIAADNICLLCPVAPMSLVVAVPMEVALNNIGNAIAVIEAFHYINLGAVTA